MSAVWMRVRGELRVRWQASVGLVLVIGIAGAVVMAAAAGARRTDSAYGRFLTVQNAGQGTIVSDQSHFFGFAGIDLDRVQHLPGLHDSARFAFFTEFLHTPSGLDLTPIGDRNPVVLFAGASDRFDRVLNRMRARTGRLPNPHRLDEVAVSYEAARRYRIRVGDVLELHTLRVSDLERTTMVPHPSGPSLGLRVTGIEVAPGELGSGVTYPAIHMTPAFYRRFAGVTANFPALAFKLSRDADLSAFLGRVESTAIVNPQATSRIEFISSVDNAKTIERTTHVQAIALWVLALLTALTTLLILFQTIARQVMLESFDYQTLEALGFSRGQLTGVAMLRWGVTAGSGAALALCLAIGMSWFAPIGIARVVEPASGIAVDAVPLLLGAAVLVVVVLAIALLHTSRVVRVSRSGQRHTAARRSRVAAALAQAGRAPAQVIGVRMALETGEGHSAVPVRSTLAGAIVGIASIVAALTFTTSINHLLDTPRLRGVSWDAVIGDAFDPGDANQVLPVVRHTRAVDQISAGGAGTLTIGGRSITAVGMDRITGNIQPVLLAGHVPLRDDEIVLANRTLRDLHTHIGGVVTASSGSRSARMLVVGTAVAPTLPTEAFNSRGAFLTFNGLRTLLPSNAEDIFLFRVRHRAQLSSVIATIHRSLPGVAIRRPSTSGDIDEIAHVRDLPLVLAGVLALLSAATLAHLIVTAVRTRRTQFAILKAIGFVGRQVQAAVAWQATTTVVVALCIAIPAGYVLGRLGWSVLADQIGFVSDPALRLWYPLAVAIGAIVTANAVGAIPSRSAARTQPAATLRAE